MSNLEKPFIIRSYGKTQLADLYGWSVKTLRRKMEFYGLKWNKDYLFTPKEVEGIVEKLGLPYSHFEE